MSHRLIISFLLVGLGGCTGGSLANQSKPTPATGGAPVSTGGTVSTPGDAGSTPDADLDPQSPDTAVNPDPLNAAAKCTSDTFWTRGENAAMTPGQACISCHRRSGEGPLYTIAGTLYPTGHEPDNCNGISGAQSGAKVIVTGANGIVLTLTANSAGNFYSTENVAMPYTVKVVDQNRIERSMFASATDGDCNGCHTQNGTNAAPGRVTLP